jgi:hypothetical protein
MGQKSSSRSDTAGQLLATKGKLEGRWRYIESFLQSQLEFKPRVISSFVDSCFWVGFSGEGSEVIARDRGRDTVIPLRKLHDDYLAWLGFREVWSQVRDTQNFIFKAVGMTVYFGREGVVSKPQLFRAEWPGLYEWSRGQIGFQTEGAGMPHWQFDTPKLFECSQPQPEIEFEGSVIVEKGVLSPPEDNDFAKALRLATDRMHFASAAPWWRNNETADSAHVNAPSTLDGLNNWTVRCMRYIHQELGRCAL